MAKEKSEFSSALEKCYAISKALVDEVLALGGDDEDISRISTDSDLRKQIAKLVVQGRRLAGGTARIFVDYTRPLAEMLKDARLGYVGWHITENNFPATQRPNAEIEIKLFHFNRVINSDEVLREMEKEGYRPAELPELLAYAKANPNEEWKHPVIILGSAWQNENGFRNAPYLWNYLGGRSLNLNWFEGVWLEDDRFLAVRK